MKNKLLISIIALVFLISFVSAGQVTQLNKVRIATLHSDGTVTYTDNPITNVNVLGFICPDYSCTSVGEKIFDTNTGSNPFITLVYPTTSNTQHYGTYFFKSGWIGYEVNSSGYGTRTAPDLTVYLAKKDQCYAPITNLQVLNQVEPNKPLMIDVTTDIDSDTHAAIQNSGPLSYNPPEVIASRLINTSVTLKIKDHSNNIIKTETKYISIDYSGTQTTHFVYTFENNGQYSIEVTTNVPDSKCLSSIPQSVSASVQVINQSETNYSYSLIQNPSISPVNPLVDESINFSFNYLSNYVNPSGTSIPINTSVYATITKGSALISQNYFLLSQQDTTTLNQFSFLKSFSSPGEYLLTLRGVPNSTYSSRVIEMTQTLQFIVGNIIQDNIPPVLSLPGTISITTLNPLGSIVSYIASATDNIDGSIAVSCSPLSGSFFSVGTTTVSCSATDSSGNTASGSFNVIVTYNPPSQCTTNSDCGSSVILNYYCNGNDLYKNVSNPSCISGVCSFSNSGMLNNSCSYGCSINHCNQQPTTYPLNGVKIIAPTNNQIFTSTLVPLRYSINGTATSCSYSLDNQPNTTLSSCQNITRVIQNGTHSIKLYATNGTKTVSDSVNFTINASIPVDTTPPIITIYSPINTIYLINSITINVSINEQGSCVYSLDNSVNKTLSQSGNYFIAYENGLSNGQHNVKVFCTDTSGNNAQSTVYFTINKQSHEDDEDEDDNHGNHNGIRYINTTFEDQSGSNYTLYEEEPIITLAGKNERSFLPLLLMMLLLAILLMLVLVYILMKKD